MVVVLNTHSLRYPFRGGGHQLHQTRCPSTRFRIINETTLLADESVYPRLIQLLLLKVALHGFAVWGEKAQTKVMQMHGPVSGADGAVIDPAATCYLCRSEQAPVIEASDTPVPFSHPLVTQIKPIEGKGPLDSRQLLDRCNLLGPCFIGLIRGTDHNPHLLFGQLAIKIVFCAERGQERIGLYILADGLERTCLPITPHARLLFRGGHGIDTSENGLPISSTQRCPDLPGELNV